MTQQQTNNDFDSDDDLDYEDSEQQFFDDTGFYEDNLKPFVNHLIKNGFVYTVDDKGSLLYSSRTNIKYTYHAEPLLYSSWVRTKNFEPIKWTKAAHAYLVHNIPFFSSFVFKPNQPDQIKAPDGTVFLNTYRTYQPAKQIKDYDFTPWITFTKHLFPDETERETIMQYLAHMFQQPQQRPAFSLFITSDQGCGKGYLYKAILEPLLCKQSALISTMQSVTTEHSTVLDKRILVILDDVATVSRSTGKRMKSLITEATQFINPKNQEQKNIECFSRFIMFTNDNQPCFEHNDRRWYVPQRLKHHISHDHTQSIIDSLEDWLTAGGLDQLYHWFLNYDLSEFNHNRCELTETFHNLFDHAATAHQNDLQVFLTNNLAFTLTQAQSALGRSKAVLKAELEKLGYSEKYLFKSGNRTRYLVHKDTSLTVAREFILSKK